MMTHCKCVLTVLLSLLFSTVSAQDSLRISIGEADRLFLRNNLLLAATQLNVDAQKALEIQAKLYPNPEFSAGVNLFDRDNKTVFYAGKNGQKTFDFQQLILLGGKRKNLIRLSGEHTRQAQLDLENLLRNLSYELHTNMYSLHFDLRTLEKYTIQLKQLDTIISTYETQSQKGNIPLKEVIRLKSVYIRLNNDKSDMLQSIQHQQKDLQVILHTHQFIVPVIDTAISKQFQYLPTLDTLTGIALQHRTDLKISCVNESLAHLNLRYQKSLAVPDLNLGTAYDQLGGAFNHQWMLTLGVPLPLWNRNQGNIRSAEIQKKQSEIQTAFQQTIVQSEVKQAWSNMQRSIQEYTKIREVYNSDFAKVYSGMQVNFVKRNISLVEFVDFFESYNETVAEVYRIRKQLMLAAENINYTTAFNIY